MLLWLALFFGEGGAGSGPTIYPADFFVRRRRRGWTPKQ